MTSLKKIFAITTGDVDGIGLEITLKALSVVRSNCAFLVFRSDKIQKSIENRFSIPVDYTCDNPKDALRFARTNKLTSKNKRPMVIYVVQKSAPAEWVEQATELALAKKIDGIITGPLSKTSILAAGLKDVGHTDILKRLSKAKFVRMGFVGKNFSVVLHSAHIPVSKIATSVTKKSLDESLVASAELAKLTSSREKIHVLGLNPHAGEQGLLGSEEKRILAPWIKRNSKQVCGPLVPDAAFVGVRNKNRVYLAMYHDQGLIPFKLIHGQDSGVHVTLGIPFIRTSVDHGTAKDIFGQGKANAGSMIDAIQWCIKFASKK